MADSSDSRQKVAIIGAGAAGMVSGMGNGPSTHPGLTDR